MKYPPSPNMATNRGVSLFAASANEYGLRIVCSLTASCGVLAFIVHPPMCGLSTLNLAGVKELRLPCKRNPGCACVVGEHRAEFSDPLRTRPITL